MHMVLRNGLRKCNHDHTWVRVIHAGYFGANGVNYKAGEMLRKWHIIEMKHEWCITVHLLKWSEWNFIEFLVPYHKKIQ